MILRATLPAGESGSALEITVTEGSEVLSVGKNARGEPSIWWRSAKSDRVTSWRVMIVWTGEAAPFHPWRYVGTVVHGQYVNHVFVREAL